jgi:hypothetical protein
MELPFIKRKSETADTDRNRWPIGNLQASGKGRENGAGSRFVRRPAQWDQGKFRAARRFSLSAAMHLRRNAKTAPQARQVDDLAR